MLLSVRPSIRLSRTYRIIQEPKGLACPNLEGWFPTSDTTRIPVSRSKCQRPRSPGSLMLTHIVRHIFRMARPIRTSNLVYRWRTMTRISHRRHDLQGQRSRSQGHVISLSRLGPMLYLCHYSPAGHTVSAEPGGHTSCLILIVR